jgi:ABC-2 type transport system permease protein
MKRPRTFAVAAVEVILLSALFFASNAIYPISIMPGWLQAISRGNPLTYEVDALRCLMVIGGVSIYGILVGIAALVAGTAILVLVTAGLYPRVV